MSLYVAAYDVANDRRRERLARTLNRYGERVQYFVFLIWADAEELPDLRREVGVDLGRDDRFDLIPVDVRGTRSRWSWQRPPHEFEPVIFGD